MPLTKSFANIDRYSHASFPAGAARRGAAPRQWRKSLLYSCTAVPQVAAAAAPSPSPTSTLQQPRPQIQLGNTTSPESAHPAPAAAGTTTLVTRNLEHNPDTSTPAAGSATGPPPQPLVDSYLRKLVANSSALSAHDLEALPPPLLAHLLHTAAARLRAMQEQLAAAADLLDQTSLELDAVRTHIEARYAVEPGPARARLGRDAYVRAAAVAAKWQPRPLGDFSSWTAHYHVTAGRWSAGRTLAWDTATARFALAPAPAASSGAGGRARPAAPPHPRQLLPVERVISSALLMYRIMCVFPAVHMLTELERYKVVWSTELRHVATGEAVGLGEWRGGAAIWVSNTEPGVCFEEDLLELLNLLCDERCPHPYDGTVAGSVAAA